MLELAALSDLHLGDEDPVNGTVLLSEEACDHFAEQVADISKGEIRTLVICGDLWEACIPTPRSVPSIVFGLDNTTMRASDRFFRALTKRVRINRLMIVPGNHDFTLYQNLAVRRELATHSPMCGYGLRSSGRWLIPDFSALLSDQISHIGIAYPNFVYAASEGWPLALFTHGHLFDTQVLAPSDELLLAFGLLASSGRVFDSVPEDLDVNPGKWMDKLVALTINRVVRIWSMNLNVVAEAVWGYVKRRQIHIVCKHNSIIQSQDQGPILTSGAGTGSMDSCDKLRWYLDGFMQDYSPVLTREDRSRVSYFVKGHTHSAGAGMVTSIDETRFRVVDLGGWTKDAYGHRDNVPHKHLLAWEHFSQEPVTYALT